MPPLTEKIVKKFTRSIEFLNTESVCVEARITEIIEIIFSCYGVKSTNWDWVIGSIDDGGSYLDSYGLDDLGRQIINISIDHAPPRLYDYEVPTELNAIPVRWLFCPNDEIVKYVMDFRKKYADLESEAKLRRSFKCNRKKALEKVKSVLSEEEIEELGIEL